MTSEKKIYPPPYEDEGGVHIPHIPTEEEMEYCAFAKEAGVECLRKEFIFGAPSQQRSCGTCTYHPYKKAIKKMFIVSKGGKE